MWKDRYKSIYILTKKENFQKLDINSIFFPWTKKFSLDVFGKYFGKSPSPNTDQVIKTLHKVVN